MRTEEILHISANRNGSTPAIIDTLGVTSYAELLTLSRTICAALKDARIPERSIIGLSLLDAKHFLAALFGVLEARCVAIPISPQLPSAEQLRVIRETGVAWRISSHPNSDRLPNEKPLHEKLLPGLFLQSEDAAASRLEAHFADAAVIRHTSGTTARSKGVVLSHRAVLERTHACAKLLDVRGDDVVLAPLPLAYHFVASALSFLRVGATILDCATLSPTEMIALGARYGATMIYGSPLQYELLSRVVTHDRLKQLRRAISTSALLPTTTANLFEARFGMRLTQVYGIIEVGLPIWNTNPTNPPSALGSCPAPYECKIIDDLGALTPLGEIGELLVRGPGLFSGYLQGESEAHAQSEGYWFHTGDLVLQDEHGALRYVGRKKSVINCAGNKIFPEEVELVLRQHHSISEVRVFSEPHPLLGSLVVAEVVPASGGQHNVTEWRDLCYNQLASFKVPKEFRIVRSLPSTGSGKVVRHTLSPEEIAA